MGDAYPCFGLLVDKDQATTGAEAEVLDSIGIGTKPFDACYLAPSVTVVLQYLTALIDTKSPYPSGSIISLKTIRSAETTDGSNSH
jgi:hypothetical protein